MEPPGAGDPHAHLGRPAATGIGLVWKSVSRNKRCVTLDLRQADGPGAVPRAARRQRRAGRRQPAERPRALGHRLRVGARRATRGVVMLHISGYGKGGPKSDRPGYGTLAEAMSGFAHVTGQPDGPPTLPPFMLADGVAVPGRHLRGDDGALPPRRARRHGPAHRRQPDRAAGPADRVVDAGLRSARDQPGPGRQPARRQRAPQRLPHRRRQVAGHLQRVARTSPCAVYRAIDRPDLAEDPDYVDPVRRQERAREVDELVADWVRRRTLDEAMARLRAGRGDRRAGLRRRAAAGRRAPAAAGHVRRDGRPGPRPDAGAGPDRPAQRDAGPHRPPRPRARRRQRGRLRRAARHRARAARRRCRCAPSVI